MKVVVCVSNVRSRKQASKILREVAKEIKKGRDSCVSGHIGTKGDFTYDILPGDPSLYISIGGFAI